MLYRVVRAENVNKSYGRRPALRDLTFAVEPGEVFGLYGPAGAGKSTTIRLMMDLIRPSSGRVLIFGHDIRAYSRDIRRQIGFLPEAFSFRGYATGAAALRYLAGLYGGVSWNYVMELSARLAIDLDRKCSRYGALEMQKLGLVQAFMHRPELLILDEPGKGLDAGAQTAFYQLVAEVRREGSSVVLATRSLQDVERVCDRVGMLQEGSLQGIERAVRLRGRTLRQVELHFAAPVPAEVFSHLNNIENLRVDANVLRCTVRGDTDPLLKLANQYRVTDLRCQQPTLEETHHRYADTAGNHAPVGL